MRVEFEPDCEYNSARTAIAAVLELALQELSRGMRAGSGGQDNGPALVSIGRVRNIRSSSCAGDQRCEAIHKVSRPWQLSLIPTTIRRGIQIIVHATRGHGTRG